MATKFTLPILADASALSQLRALQQEFSAACNDVAALAAASRCWNRVALHHLAYRDVRERRQKLGSQMVCNAVYAVSMAARAVYEDPASPFCVANLGAAPLPIIYFKQDAPVYVDRRTLSVKGDRYSLFTLDGRLRFTLPDSEQVRSALQSMRLQEVLLAQAAGAFYLHFQFEETESAPVPVAPPRRANAYSGASGYSVVAGGPVNLRQTRGAKS